jgi:hypothetical protein
MFLRNVGSYKSHRRNIPEDAILRYAIELRGAEIAMEWLCPAERADIASTDIS